MNTKKTKKTNSKFLPALLKDTKGAGFSEYVVLIGLLVIVVSAAVLAFGSAVGEELGQASTWMGSVVQQGSGS